MEPYEWPTLQLMSIMRGDKDKDKLNSFPYTSRTNSTVKGKNYILLYAEDLHFLISHAVWLFTHIYEHYTLEWSKFKKRFCNEPKWRQKATSSVERDFFKLLNNSNFGIYCRNNIDNCILECLDDDFDDDWVRDVALFDVTKLEMLGNNQYQAWKR